MAPTFADQYDMCEKEYLAAVAAVGVARTNKESAPYPKKGKKGKDDPSERAENALNAAIRRVNRAIETYASASLDYADWMRGLTQPIVTATSKRARLAAAEALVAALTQQGELDSDTPDTDEWAWADDDWGGYPGTTTATKTTTPVLTDDERALQEWLEKDSEDGATGELSQREYEIYYALRQEGMERTAAIGEAILQAEREDHEEFQKLLNAPSPADEATDDWTPESRTRLDTFFRPEKQAAEEDEQEQTERIIGWWKDKLMTDEQYTLLRTPVHGEVSDAWLETFGQLQAIGGDEALAALDEIVADMMATA